MKDLNAIIAYKMLEMVKALLNERGEASFSAAPGSADAYTYKSTQATNCAVCGQHKHTPLRNDEMGGYVCLTCIDKELLRLQAASPQNAEVSEGGTRDSRIETAAQSRPSLH